MRIVKIHYYIVVAAFNHFAFTWCSIENNFCSEQHFCSCPPFLRYSSPGHESEVHFTKHNYDDQYAILGKSKELHCCVGPSYQQLKWYKDGVEFPWDQNEGKTRNSILYSNNQSLILMEVRAEDSGRFTCVAKAEVGHSISHTTRLKSFPPPVFAHPPIWNQRPRSTQVRLGGKAKIECSVTVGQQYNTVSMQPVYAAWLRYGRELEDGDRVKITQQWTDDDIVIHLKLEINAIEEEDAGDYICKVKNEYGDLEKKVTVSIEDNQESKDDATVKKEIRELFKKQIKIYSILTRFTTKHQAAVQVALNQAEAGWN